MIHRPHSYLFIAAASATFLFPPAAAYGSIIGLDLHQATFEQGAQSQPFSDWGEALVTFEGKSTIQYFNLARDGVWVIENAPLSSIEGTGVSQSLSINFDLGNTPGNPITSMLAAYALTDSPITSQPTNNTPFTISERKITVGGIDGSPFVPGPGVPFLQPFGDPGWLPVDLAVNPDMVNQEVGVDECVPGAFSNSLKWLDERSKYVSIPEDKKTVAALKTVVNWRPPTVKDGKPVPGTGGANNTGIRKKGPEYTKYGVVTKEIRANDIDGLLAELKHHEDIEVNGANHMAVLTCVIKHANGKATLCVTHDTEQGKAGGLKTQVIGYDPASSSWLTNAYGFRAGTGVDWFVSESPVPEPKIWWLVAAALSLVLGVRSRLRRPALDGQPERACL